eukprot:403367914
MDKYSYDFDEEQSPLQKHASNDGIQRNKKDEHVTIDEIANKNNEDFEKKFNLRRGDGLSDFLSVKRSFYKLLIDFKDAKDRVVSLEENFHKTSLLMRSNELVTTSGLQSYMDSLQTHIDAQIETRFQRMQDEFTKQLNDFKEESFSRLKEKASKKTMNSNYQFVLDTVKESDFKISQVLGSIDLSIIKKISHKAETTDVESLEKNKADISAFQEMQERVQRIEMIMHEVLSGDSNHDEYDENEERTFDDDVDSEELKDQVNNSSYGPSRFKRGDFQSNDKNSTIDQDQQEIFSNKDDQEKHNRSQSIHDDHKIDMNLEEDQKIEANIDLNLKIPNEMRMREKQNSTTIQIIETQKQALDSFVDSNLKTRKISRKQSKRQNNHKNQTSSHAKPFDQDRSAKNSTTANLKKQSGDHKHNDNQSFLSPINPNQNQQKTPVNRPGLQNQIDIFTSSLQEAQQEKQIQTARKIEDYQDIQPSIGVKIKLSNNKIRIENSSKTHFEKEISEKSEGHRVTKGHGRQESVKDRSPMNQTITHDMVSNASSLRNTFSRLGSQSPYKKHKVKLFQSKVGNGLEITQELENLKRELYLMSQNLKDIQEQQKQADSEAKPHLHFIQEHHSKLLSLLKSHDTLQQRLHEHETYDAKLKDQYLKKSVTEMKKMKEKVEKEQISIRKQYDEDKDYYKNKMKVFEVNQESLKMTMDLVKKKLQDQKLNFNSVVGGSTQITGGQSILSQSIDQTGPMFQSTQQDNGNYTHTQRIPVTSTFLDFHCIYSLKLLNRDTTASNQTLFPLKSPRSQRIEFSAGSFSWKARFGKLTYN